jgi:hypothetical protein
MRDHHLHFASARRDDRLARVRKLTLWIGGGAAAASLGLGTAFAHALPGHTAGSQTTGSTRGVAAAGSSGAGSAGTGSAGAGKHGRRHGHHLHALARPQQQPTQAPAPAPPVVSSGGS